MKRIATLIIMIFLLGAGAVYAGQEQPCDHSNYTIIYKSETDTARIFCEECGETHKLKMFIILTKSLENIWH